MGRRRRQTDQLKIPESGEVIDGFLWFRVHPSARGGSLETQIINWGKERMRSVRQERGVRVKLRSGARDAWADRIALLESCGFTADRYFFTMERSLDEPISEPVLPAGLTLRHVNLASVLEQSDCHILAVTIFILPRYRTLSNCLHNKKPQPVRLRAGASE